MTRRKIAVGDLGVGMYVAELDRPWIESPFLFQGFVISSSDELEKLRGTCRHVFIEDAPNTDSSERTIRRSMNVRVMSSPRQSHSEWQRVTSEDRRVSFQRELDRANTVRQRTQQYVDGLLADARLGRAIDTGTARLVVADMVNNVISDPEAALWLTQLKRAHQYTAQHCVNVSVLSIAFGAHLGYSREQLQIIGLGALLHDVGKMKVPRQVLEKPGRLTPEEFEIMKRHPVDGYELLKASPIPAQALQIVRFHHERISGKGYPDGLSGDQIPTAVLVTAICDVYDALTSDRVYRHGLPPDQGLHAMYQMAPSDFGKGLVHEFIKCIGIYPVGSLVELTNGAIGIVMTKDPNYKLRPVVMLICDPQGREYHPRRFISLATQTTLDPRRDWDVAHVLDPRQCKVDLERIASEELLSGGYQVVHV